MPTPDEIKQIRFIEGVNRTEDARLTDAGSWYSTENLYGRSPGHLAKRPGSRLIINGVAGADCDIVVPDRAWDIATSKFTPGEVDLNGANTVLNVMPPSARSAAFADVVVADQRGTRNDVAKINPLVLPTKDLPNLG